MLRSLFSQAQRYTEGGMRSRLYRGTSWRITVCAVMHLEELQLVQRRRGGWTDRLIAVRVPDFTGERPR